MKSVQSNITAATGVRPAVYVAIELSKKSWLIALRGPAVDRISLHRLAVGDAAGLLALIERLRRAAVETTGAEVAVLACQEAGYDGFWLHRVLVASGITSHVVDDPPPA
jgi:transposase